MDYNKCNGDNGSCPLHKKHDKAGKPLPSRAKQMALKERTSKRKDAVGSRKKDFTQGGQQGNWMKVHKLDRI